MRIAHIANFYGPTSGGLRTAMHALGRGYVAAGHEVLIVVPGDADRDELTAYGRRIMVRSPRLPFSGGYRVIVRTRAVKRILRDFAPDVLEVSDRTTLRGIGGWARLRGIPSVFFAHERADGVMSANTPARLARVVSVTRLADWHNRGTHRRFTAVVCTTDFAAAEFRRAGLETVLVPLGVDLEAFHPSHYSQDVRTEYAPDDVPLVLMASRLSGEKRPQLAIDAVRELTARGVTVRMVSAGTGAIAAAMEQRARGLPITFLGFMSDRERFASLLASADVVVAPGPIETFGLAALEALASGTPVVVNAASALPEVVGEAGVAAAGNPKAFADAVQEVLSWDPVARRVQARARAETLPWDETVKRMLALHASHLTRLGS